MDMLAIIYPLSGWLGNAGEAMRIRATEMGSSIPTVALSLACLFFGIRLIKMYYDIVSDEQYGGFGGVRMWDILRPICIILLISGFSEVVIKPVDWLANKAAAIVSAGGGANSFSSGNNKLKDSWKKAQAEARKSIAISNNAEAGKSAANVATETLIESINNAAEMKEKGGLVGKFVSYVSLNPMSTTAKIGKNVLKHEVKKTVANYDDPISKAITNVQVFFKSIGNWAKKGCGTLIDVLLTWWFNIMARVMQVMADLMMTMLVIVAPLMMAFSVFDRWKGYIWTFMGQYIQLSLWKPLVSLILYSTTSIHSVTSNNIADAFSNLDGTELLGSILGGIGMTIVIVYAGIQCIKQVPSIASSLVSLASGIGSPASAGGAAGALMGAAGMAARTGGRMAGGMVGGAVGGIVNGTGGIVKGANVGANIARGISNYAGSAIGKVGGLFK